MNPRWLVIWSHNGNEHWESFEFRMMAEFRMIQLEGFHVPCQLIDLFKQPELLDMLLVNSGLNENNVN